MEQNAKLLKDAASGLGVSLTDGQIGQFMSYMDELLIWNERMNLTAITQRDEVVLKHFADCISIVPYLNCGAGVSMIDVGTGAGFPGIPVKIACPDVEMVLLDSLQKRVGFLEYLVEKLELLDVECVHARAEDGGQNPVYRERFDYCVSRAVANLAVLAEYCLPFVKVGGYLVALKGPDVDNELLVAGDALAILGGTVERIEDISIPFTDLAHKLVFIKKVSNTPAKYPRRASKIAKDPLK